MTDSACTIRRAVVADADAVGRLWQTMADQHRTYDSDVWCWAEDSPQTWRDDYAKLIERDELLSLVAETLAGDVVGFVSVKIMASESVFSTKTNGFIWDLVVCPDHRRNDVGRTLMTRVFDELKQRNVDDVILHVAVDNAAALALYERLGMRRVMYRMYKRL